MDNGSAAFVAAAGILVGLSVAVAVGSVTAATAAVQVSMDGPGQVSLGESLTIEVRVTADTPIYGVQFTATFAPESLAGVEVSKGPFLAGNASSVVVADNVQGTRIEYGETRTGVQTGVTGSGLLATIDLRVPTDTSAGSVDLAFESVKVSDAEAQAIEAGAAGISVPVDSSGGNGDVTGATTDTQGAANTATVHTTPSVKSVTPVTPATTSMYASVGADGSGTRTPGRVTTVDGGARASTTTGPTLIPTPTFSPKPMPTTETPGQAGFGFLLGIVALLGALACVREDSK